MTEPAKIAYPVRLDDLIDVIKTVHTEPLEQLTDACWRPSPSARSPII